MHRTRGSSATASAAPRSARGRGRLRIRPFPFQRLPPAIRAKILELAIGHDEPIQLGFAGHRAWLADAIKLFRTSRAMCEESMAIFYGHCKINSWSYQSRTAERFLARPEMPQASAVRKLCIHFQIKDNMSLFETLFSPSLHCMAKHGRLRDLEIIIGTKEPPILQNSLDLFPLARLRLSGARGHQLVDFAFLAEPPFQALLKLVSDPDLTNVEVCIEKDFHLLCWCPFHEGTADGENCVLYRGHRPVPRGSVMSLHDPAVLKMDWESLVFAYLGATIVGRLPPDLSIG